MYNNIKELFIYNANSSNNTPKQMHWPNWFIQRNGINMNTNLKWIGLKSLLAVVRHKIMFKGYLLTILIPLQRVNMHWQNDAFKEMTLPWLFRKIELDLKF